MLYDNTTVTGSWVNNTDMADLKARYNRTANNITMAMPHSGVIAAARDPLNGITPPHDVSVSIKCRDRLFKRTY